MRYSLLKFAFLFIAASCVCGMCSKGDDDNDTNQDNNSVTGFSFVGNSSDRWTATKIDKPEILSSGVVFGFTNNGNSVYNQTLKTKYPGLTEKISVFLFTNNLQTGRYSLKYGQGSQGTAEFAVQQTSANSPLADSLYRIIEVGAESYFQIDKIENNKMSGVFYFYFSQPISGANSLKVLECKEGKFTAIPIK